MKPPSECCGNCRFYSGGLHRGMCHRGPPVENPESHNSANRWTFPIVWRDTDWCGEWRPEPEPADPQPLTDPQPPSRQ